MSQRRPRVGITMGDPSGIGPEVVVKALRAPAVKKALDPVVFGDASLSRHLPSWVQLEVVSQLLPRECRPGQPSRSGGRAQLAYIERLVDWARQGRLDGLCTAPVSKEQISLTGFHFFGHTELLASAFRCETLMLMEGPRLKLALATNHLPLREVPAALTTQRLYDQLQLLARSFVAPRGRPPRIAVCGLNPHGGDGGLLGTEEKAVIAPAVALAKAAGVRCDGPFSADGLIAQLVRGKAPYDVALAMFHDQALVAVKALDFERTVNVTLGLPLPRTSPDHGVAYDLAGKGRAGPRPMIEALLKVAELCRGARKKPFAGRG